MSETARQALRKLLRMTENAVGKESDRAISLRFSDKSFPAYLSFNTHADKQACNAHLILAMQNEAIAIDWDRQAGDRAHISRIVLINRQALADFIGVTPRWDAVATAKEALSSFLEKYPILREAIKQWESGLKVKGTAPHQFKDWIDAIQVVEQCRKNQKEDIAVRRLSASMMHDSKRIESIYSIIDAVFQNNLSAFHRSQEEVFSELGLVKFPPTFLVSGKVAVTYGAVVTNVIEPYIGFAPSMIDNFQIYTGCIGVLSVENLTTFHELAARRKECTELIILYTGGMPSRSWVSAYRKLLAALPKHVFILHWGDIDSGGFRIANRIASICTEVGHYLQLHMMGAGVANFPRVSRHVMSENEVKEIITICKKHNWRDELAWVERNRLAVEQESLPLEWPNY